MRVHTHAHTHTHARTHMHAHAHARTGVLHARTHGRAHADRSDVRHADEVTETLSCIPEAVHPKSIPNPILHGCHSECGSDVRRARAGCQECRAHLAAFSLCGICLLYDRMPRCVACLDSSESRTSAEPQSHVDPMRHGIVCAGSLKCKTGSTQQSPSNREWMHEYARDCTRACSHAPDWFWMTPTCRLAILPVRCSPCLLL